MAQTGCLVFVPAERLGLLCPQQVNVRKHQNSGLWLSIVLVPCLHQEVHMYMLGGVFSASRPTIFPGWVPVSLSSALLCRRFLPQLQLLAAMLC